MTDEPRLLDRLMSAGKHWIARHSPGRLRMRLQQVERASAQARVMVGRWKDKSARDRHRVLAPTVLRHVLPARAATFASRSHCPDAQARHAALVQVSASYRATVADGGDETAKIAQPVTIHGLTFWVPLDVGQPERLARVAAQGLPLRAIAQTRELAVGAVMLDLGANIGRTAIPRVILGDVQVVYAAEPDPLNYRCLAQNVLDNGLRGFVLPDQVAIGSHEGEAVLQRSAHIGGHKLLRPDAKPGKREVISVPCCTLDRWVQKLGVDVSAVCFVKVDTQGWEPHVLAGARGLLERKHIAWQLEVSPRLLRGAGYELREVLALLERHFSHVIDLNSEVTGPRVRQTEELREVLGYLEGDLALKTDLLLY